MTDDASQPASTPPAGTGTAFFDAPAANSRPVARLLLAHGAGAPVTSPFMDRMTELLAARNIAVVRFEFAYMAARRKGGKRRPPPRAEMLVAEYVAAVAALAARDGQAPAPLFIGGKSLGGRVASMAAAELFDAGKAAGVICLGYPFHPPGMPEKIRTAHLAETDVPMLIVQGERDPFGSREEIKSYELSPRVEIVFAADGDHDLGPRGGKGTTRRENLASAADAIAAFVENVVVVHKT